MLSKTESPLTVFTKLFISLNSPPSLERHMKNSYICELTSTSGKYKVDNTLILPIKRANGRVAGAIEVNFFDRKGDIITSP